MTESSARGPSLEDREQAVQATIGLAGCIGLSLGLGVAGAIYSFGRELPVLSRLHWYGLAALAGGLGCTLGGVFTRAAQRHFARNRAIWATVGQLVREMDHALAEAARDESKRAEADAARKKLESLIDDLQDERVRDYLRAHLSRQT